VQDFIANRTKIWGASLSVGCALALWTPCRAATTHYRIRPLPIFLHCNSNYMSLALSPYHHRYPGLSSVLVSIAFPFAFPLPFAFHIYVFYIHSSSPAIEFNSCFFFPNDVSALIGVPFTYSLFR